MTVPYGLTHETARENVLRGAMFALLVIPPGIVLWSLIWSFGIVASIVAYAIAFGAAWLYRKGSGGIIGRSGAFAITGVIVVALLLSFYFGLVSDYAIFVGKQIGGGPFAALAEPRFWPAFNSDFPALFQGNAPSFGIALLLGALGAYGVIRRAFAEANATARPGVPMQPLFPSAGPSAPQGSQLPQRSSAAEELPPAQP